MFHRRREVISLSIDEDKCIGCAACITVCRPKVLDMWYGVDSCHAWVKYKNDCRGCGKCQRVCTEQAIELVTK